MEKEFDLSEILPNIESVGEEYNSSDLILENKVEGNLKDVLKGLDEDQINIIASVYYDEKNAFFRKSIDNKIELLEEKIKGSFKKLINNASYSQYVILDKLSNKEDVTNMSELFLYSGFSYSYYDKTEVKYLLPSDLKKIYLNEVDPTIKGASLKGEILTRIMALFFSNGLVPTDLVYSCYPDDFYGFFTKDELLEEIDTAVSIKKINNKEYFWLIDTPYENLYEESIDDRVYIRRDLNDIVPYMMSILMLIEEICKIIKKPYKETLSIIISKILLKERSLDDILDDFVSELGLSKKDSSRLDDILIDYYDNLRYWENGGNTQDEILALNLVLKEKPKNSSIDECLKQLTDNAKEEFKDTYNIDDVSSLDEIIVDDFCNEGYLTIDNDDDISELLELDGKEYNGNEIVTSFIINGYAYLYKDKDNFKVILPDEIKDVINNFDLSDDYGFNGLDDREIINLYMLYNGIIEKKILQRLLQENHDLEYTIDELDTVIKTLDMYCIDNYYCVLEETDEVIDKFLLPSKKNFKKYKMVDFDSYYELDSLNTLESELRSYINKLCKNEDTAREIGMYLITLINMNCYVPDILIPIFEDYKIKASNTDYKNINNIINKSKNDIPIWAFNGYTKKEVNSMPKEKKVGRNDPCPCGSGKKYKKCCGK